MDIEREIKRYSAYYRGWCLAFGEHDIVDEDNDELNWAFGESQVGFVVSPRLRRRLFRQLLGRRHVIPVVRMSPTKVRINRFEYRFSAAEQVGVARFLEFVRAHVQLHMFLTSHFCYPPGTRIITFSPKKPVIILYKEITPLRLVVSEDTGR